MKTQPTQILLLAGFGLAIGTLLPSCVEPHRGTRQTVTTYQPGLEVKSLPKGYQTEVIAGTTYYCHGGTYYRPKQSKYVVVADPRMVDRLPRGYRTIHHRTGTYYEYNKVYYQKSGSRYCIVHRPE
jgi:hypothetical protein